MKFRSLAIILSLILTVSIFSQEEGEKKLDTRQIMLKQSFANTKRKHKDYREALSLYEELFALDPELKLASELNIKYRAECYEELGILDSAKIFYEEYLVRKPDNTGIIKKLEFMYISEGDLEGAIELNKRLMESDEDKAKYLKKIGDLYWQIAQNFKMEDEEAPEVAENEKLALEVYNKYIEINPNDPDVDKKAIYLTKKHMDTQALKDKYEEALAKDPEDFKTMERLAHIYYDENNISKAKEYYEKIYANSADNINVIKRLIRIHANNKSKAIELNRKAIELEPSNDTFNLNLGRIYLDNKQYKAARSQALEALRKNRGNKRAYKLWGDVYAQSIADCAAEIKYNDKLVYIIAYGLYKKGGYDRQANVMAQAEQVPTKADYFVNKSLTRPSGKCYKWIDLDWNEVSYIDEFLKRY